MPENGKSPYEILGVSEGASDREISKRFRTLAHGCHPDTNPGKDESEFKELQNAYELISTAEKREHYHFFGRGNGSNTTGSAGADGVKSWAGAVSGSMMSITLFRRELIIYAKSRGLGYSIHCEQLPEMKLKLNFEFKGSATEVGAAQRVVEALLAAEKRAAEQQREHMKALRQQQAEARQRAEENEKRYHAEAKQAVSDIYNVAFNIFFRTAMPGFFLMFAFILACLGAMTSAGIVAGFAVLFAIVARVIDIEGDEEVVTIAARKPWGRRGRRREAPRVRPKQKSTPRATEGS